MLGASWQKPVHSDKILLSACPGQEFQNYIIDKICT